MPRRGRVVAGVLAALTAAGAPAILTAPSPAHAQPLATVSRLAGADRYATAAAVSRATFPDGARHVFVATGRSFADALAAAPLAASARGPVLLTDRDTLPPATAAELGRLHPDDVVVVGGPAAVSDAVVAAVARVASVSRVAGADRYATAAAVAGAFGPAIDTAYVATGSAFADAVAGGAAASSSSSPLLLVAPTSVPSATAAAIARLRPARIVVLGGDAAVAPGVVDALRSTAPSVTRIAGADRYDTAARLSASTVTAPAPTVYAATGSDFADALTGGVAAGLAHAPLLLTSRDSVPQPTATELARLAPGSVVVLGGASAVSDTTAAVLGGAPPLALKPVIAGIVQRDGLAPPAALPLVNGAVVKVNWAELQPTAGGPIADDNAIDRALAKARAFEAANPGTTIALKLRVLAGFGAPDWAKSLDGPPVTIIDPDLGRTGTIARFWTPAFDAAYRDLQQKLAARYDGADEVREVAITRCTTVYGEPFIRQMDAPATPPSLVAAGFTLDADAQCHRDEIDAHRVWTRTRSSLALNPYQAIQPDGRVKIDVGFTIAMMDECRAALGARCVLGNNSIRTTSQGPNYAPMYDAIRQRGGPIYFQTMPMDQVGDLLGALTWAAAQGAEMVELPQGYLDLPLDLLRPVDVLLEANA